MLNGCADTMVNQDLERPLRLESLIFLSLFYRPLLSPHHKWGSYSRSLFYFKVGGQNFDGCLPRLDRQLHGIPSPILGAEQFDGTGAIIANPLETRRFRQKEAINPGRPQFQRLKTAWAEAATSVCKSAVMVVAP